MKLDIIMHLTKCSEGSMVASCRIANYLLDKLPLGFELIDVPEKLPDIMKVISGDIKIRNFLLVNSPTGFAPPEMRNAAAVFNHMAEKSVFVQNDYKMMPPSQCKSYVVNNLLEDPKGEANELYGFELWSTVVGNPKCNPKLTRYIDWNMLTYNPMVSATPIKSRVDGVMYWGALRKGREVRLKRFLDSPLEFETFISTAPQTVSKFKHYLPEANFIPKLTDLTYEVSKYKLTLYTQDEFSDTTYCSLANRFYESLSAGIAIAIDVDCASTFEFAGVEGFEKFLVSDSSDIHNLLIDCEKVAETQSRLWKKDYASILETRLEKLVVTGLVHE